MPAASAMTSASVSARRYIFAFATLPLMCVVFDPFALMDARSVALAPSQRFGVAVTSFTPSTNPAKVAVE